MRHFVILFIFCLAGVAQAASAEKNKNMQDALIGKWLGFCSPQALTNSSRLCSYTFKKSGSGVYECEHFKDLRCSGKAEKVISSAFNFKVFTEPDKTGRANIEFIDREDIRQEKSRMYLTGDTLRVQVYEVMRMPAANEEKLDSQGVVPFYEFTKVKTP